MTAKLKLVGKAEQPIDIQALNRADIERRDWSSCHIFGDRSKPVFLPERVRRIWRLA